jgi:hypothetical protein
MVERSSPTVSLQDRAADNLRFIRETMERAGAFTAVPGWGGIIMGVSAIGAAVWAHSERGPDASAWLRIWLLELALAVVVGAVGLFIKARRFAVPLFRGAGRKFALSLAPPLFVGGLLTLALVRWGETESLPGVWMLLYGAGVATGGAFSVRVVPVLGVLFMIAGAITLFLPIAWGDWVMALTFGGLHIIFGWVIARRYGG